MYIGITLVLSNTFTIEPGNVFFICSSVLFFPNLLVIKPSEALISSSLKPSKLRESSIVFSNLASEMFKDAAFTYFNLD